MTERTFIRVPPEMADIFQGIVGERIDQDKQWGVTDHDPIMWSTIISKHAGRLSDKALEAFSLIGNDSEEVYAFFEFTDQAVKVAALCVAAIECIAHRQEWSWPIPDPSRVTTGGGTWTWTPNDSIPPDTSPRSADGNI